MIHDLTIRSFDPSDEAAVIGLVESLRPGRPMERSCQGYRVRDEEKGDSTLVQREPMFEMG